MHMNERMYGMRIFWLRNATSRKKEGTKAAQIERRKGKNVG